MFVHPEMYLSSSSYVPGEKLECGEFRGLLVLRLLAYNVGVIHVFSRHITKRGLTVGTVSVSKASFSVCYFPAFGENAIQRTLVPRMLICQEQG